MAYAEDDSIALKEIFKYYKSNTHSFKDLSLLDQSLESCFQDDSRDKSPTENYACATDQISWKYLPGEDLFVVRNFLQNDTVDRLVRAALTEWTTCCVKSCNLGELCTSTSIWMDSLINLGSGHKWDQTPLGKLRWITLGYHYDWTNRRYTETERDEFPSLLAAVSRDVVHALMHQLTDGLYAHLPHSAELRQACAHFNPEAAIVNYYRGKTTMGFHTDEVEFDKQAPLVSLSLGPTAIYLLETAAPVQPNPPFPHHPGPSSVVPIVLRHGDVVIMMGRSRLAKHAVPAILFKHATMGEREAPVNQMAARCARQLCPDCAMHAVASGDIEDNQLCFKCTAISQYLLSTRININVRQVVPFGCRFSDFAVNQ